MPHGISARKAHRLAKDVSAFMQQRHLQLGVSPSAAGPEERIKFGGLDYDKSSKLGTYLEGHFMGALEPPNALEIADAAEVFGRAMGRRELLELAQALRKHGL